MKLENSYSISKKFVFRSPVFSINLMRAKNLSHSVFKEAIFLASPDLHSFYYCLDNHIEQHKRNDAHVAILKYYSRICSRCTPFGIFAGCGIGEIHDNVNSSVSINQIDSFESKTRLDMNYLCLLIDILSKNEEIKNKIKFYPNTSIYLIGNSFRYIEYIHNNKQKEFIFSEVDYSEILAKILNKSGNGLFLSEIKSILLDDDFDVESVEAYIGELIDNQILISELYPKVTGKDLLEHIFNLLLKRNADSCIIDRIREIKNLLEIIDKMGLGQKASEYSKLFSLIKQLGIPNLDKNIIQTDLLIKPKHALIGSSIVKSVKEGLTVLNKLSTFSKTGVMSKFKDDFYKRYESQKVPLVLALDPEYGIGFGGYVPSNTDVYPLVQNLPNVKGSNSSKEEIFNSKDKLLLKKILESQIKQSFEVEITDSDIEAYHENWDTLPLTFSSIISIINSNDSDNRIFINSAFGSSAANLIARFGYLSDSISGYLSEILNKENELVDNNTIIAEIAHLPQSRLGNILNRCESRNFEIPYLAKSNVVKENQIAITDILISLDKNKLVLTSKQTNKRIIPRLTSAHNYRNNSLPIYNFLCSLQAEEAQVSFQFNWGNLVSNQPFYPRVVYKNCILSPATWKILKSETEMLSQIGADDVYNWILKFKDEKKIPSKVCLVSGDNKLLIDFDDKDAIALFITEIQGKTVTLEEFLFSNDNANFIIDSTNKDIIYANEVIISFFKNVT